MKLYFVNANFRNLSYADEIFRKFNYPRHYLISYHYYQKEKIDRAIDKYFAGVAPEIIADSGAFSSYTKGSPIRIEEYAAWLKQWQSFFAAYANLDLIGDVLQSRKNQSYLESQGLTPFPVFHLGESYEELKAYCRDYSYVALGGLYRTPNTPAVWDYVVRCFRIREDNFPHVQFHGFGITVYDMIRNLPWYSVDSTTWVVGAAYGRLLVFDKQAKKLLNISKNDARAIQRNMKYIYHPHLNLAGVTSAFNDKDALRHGAYQMMQLHHSIENDKQRTYGKDYIRHDL